jgi:ABC-type transport system involved in multi-copper enzyme maturation permease subunit
MRRLLTGLPASMLGYFVLLEAMLVAAILYWPNFEENVGALRAMAAPIPALVDLVSQIEETGVLGYVTGQHFFKGCNTLGGAAAVLFAAGAVAGEVHRGTLEIWLARPFTRTRLLTERWIAGALALAIPVFASAATIPLLVRQVDEYVELWPMMLCSIHEVVFLLGLYSLTFLLSTIGSRPTRITLVVLFLSTFEFAIYMVKQVTHTSLFRLADIEVFVRITDERAFDWGILGGLLGFVVACYVASVVLFQRRVP